MTRSPKFKRRAVARAAVCVLGSMLASAAGAQAYPGDPGMIGDPASWRTTEFLADWGLGAMKTEYAYAAGFTGKGVKLGVIDSGFDVRHTRELPLGRFTALVTATSNGAYSEFAADGALLNGSNSAYGVHGTHVAGTVGASRDGDDIKNNMHGVAFNANVVVGSTNAGDSLSSEAQLSPGIYSHATTENFRNLYQGMRDAGVRAINNSWGNPTGPFSIGKYNTLQAVINDYKQFLMQPSWLDAAIDATKTDADGKEGVIQVFVADNQRSENPAARGALPYFRPEVEGHWLTVTAVQKVGQAYAQVLNKCGIAKYWCVAAPGGKILSTVLDGEYEAYTGTSMAAPHATGALGIVMERFPYMTNEQALQVLLTTATKLDGTRQMAPDESIGWGLINLENAMKGPGQLLKRTAIDMPGGMSDTWRNDISETGLIQRKKEEAAEIVRLSATAKEPITEASLKPVVEQAYVLIKALADAILTGRDHTAALAAAKANVFAVETATNFEYYLTVSKPGDSLWEQVVGLLKAPVDFGPLAKEMLVQDIPDWVRLTSLRGKTDDDYRGSLVKKGEGRLVLTGTNSYSGDTHIQAGELALGEGGTTGSITSHVAIDAGASLAIDRSDAYDFAHNITGAGHLRTTGGANGEGVTTLSGANSYAGVTWVQGGTLRAGSATGLSHASAFTVAGKAKLDLNGFDATIGSLQGAGDVAVGTGTLTTGGDNHSTLFTGRFNGSGGLVKAGAGDFFLTGDSAAFTGKTSVAQGMLSVNGALGGQMAVQSGGRLQGVGTVGHTTIAAGGVVAPGNSVGALRVAGNARFAPGSAYEAELGTGAQADLLDVSGKATLEGGTVHVLGDYAPGTRYTLLNAEGGVSGTFFDLSAASKYLFVTPALGYTANQVYTELARNSLRFASVAQSANQRAMGDSLDAAAAWSPVLAAALQLESASTARTAFDSLSGEVHASAKTALLEDSRFVREAAVERLRASAGTAGASTAQVKVDDGAGRSHSVDPTTRDTVFWSQALYSTGRAQGDGNAARLGRSVDGLLMGGDARVGDDWRLGVIGGYSRSKVEVNERSSSGDATSYHLGLYGGTTRGPWALRAGAAYARHDVEAQRQARVAGLSDSLKSNYDAATTQVFGEVGYSLPAGDVALEPFANLAHVTLHTDAFSERGTWAALQARSGSANLGLSTLGLRASTAVRLGNVDATLKGMVGWRRAFGDLTPFTSVALPGATGFSDIAGVAVAKNAAVLQLGMDFAFSPRATFGVSYGGQFGGKARDQSVKANLNVSF